MVHGVHQLEAVQLGAACTLDEVTFNDSMRDMPADAPSTGTGLDQEGQQVVQDDPQGSFCMAGEQDVYAEGRAVLMDLARGMSPSRRQAFLTQCPVAATW